MGQELAMKISLEIMTNIGLLFIISLMLQLF